MKTARLRDIRTLAIHGNGNEDLRDRPEAEFRVDLERLARSAQVDAYLRILLIGRDDDEIDGKRSPRETVPALKGLDLPVPSRGATGPEKHAGGGIPGEHSEDAGIEGRFVGSSIVGENGFSGHGYLRVKGLSGRRLRGLHIEITGGDPKRERTAVRRVILVEFDEETDERAEHRGRHVAQQGAADRKTGRLTLTRSAENRDFT